MEEEMERKIRMSTQMGEMRRIGGGGLEQSSVGKKKQNRIDRKDNRSRAR